MIRGERACAGTRVCTMAIDEIRVMRQASWLQQMETGIYSMGLGESSYTVRMPVGLFG